MIRTSGSLFVGAFLLAGCVYPYETAFQACDDTAGACYRFCEPPESQDGVGDSEADADSALRQCHLACEEEASQCFADAYAASEYRSSAYAYGGPWYGSYGYWRPRYGYIYSFDYYHYRGYRGRRYDPYYYGGGRGYHGRRGRYDGGGRGRHHGRRGGGQGGAGDAAPPPRTPPPRVAPPPRTPPGAAPPGRQPAAPITDRPRRPIGGDTKRPSKD